MTPDLSLAVCTHRRNDLLRQTLASLAAAERPPGFVFEALVVDNSDAGEAQGLVAEAARTLPVRYLRAHPANISVARNAAGAAARAPWLAFVDDDETLAPDWLAAARRAIARSGADALFGAVIPRFEAGARPSATARRVFARDFDLPEGAPLFAYGPEKSRAAALGSGNALLRVATTLRAHRFAPEFGRAGGEDYDLFCRLQRAGRRFAWAPSLRVEEYVPAARCDPAYLRRRAYAGGQVYAAAVARASARPAWTRGVLRAKALTQALWLAPGAALGRQRDDARFRLAGALGKLSWGDWHALYSQA